MKKKKCDGEGNEEAQPSKRYKDSIRDSAINKEDISLPDHLPVT